MRRIAYSSRYHDALVVGPSPITGRGLFAGAVAELDRMGIDARGTRRGSRFINHSFATNTFMRRTRDRAEFYALRDIAAGEELTVDYRPSHHDGRLRCRCGAPRCGGWI